MTTWYSRMASMEMVKGVLPSAAPTAPPKNGSLLSPPSMLTEVLTPRWPAMARLPRWESTTTWGVRVARLVKLRSKTGRLVRASGLTKAAELERSESRLETEAITSTVVEASAAMATFRGAASPRLRVSLMLPAVWKPCLVTVTT